VPVFYEAAAPSTDELEAVLLKIITRTMRILTRLGVVIEEPDRTYLAETATDGALRSLQAASCTYRITLGAHRLLATCDHLRKFLRNLKGAEQKDENMIRQVILPYLDRQIAGAEKKSD